MKIPLPTNRLLTLTLLGAGLALAASVALAMPGLLPHAGPPTASEGSGSTPVEMSGAYYEEYEHEYEEHEYEEHEYEEREYNEHEYNQREQEEHEYEERGHDDD